MKIKFKREKDGTCSFQFKSLTQEKAMTLCNAVYLYSQQSAVCEDFIMPIKNALNDSKSISYRDYDDELFELITRDIKEMQ